MNALQQSPEQTSDTDSINMVDGIEISTLNQTHWNSISDAVARQNHPKNGQISGVADDIALEVIERHLSDVETASKAEVVLIQDWLNSYGLKLAERKTDAVLKSRIKKVEQELVKEGNFLVKAKPEIGYLGLLLNTKLKFMQHLQYADKHIPKDRTVVPLKSTNVKGLGKLMLIMNVSTAALLYPSTKRDLALDDKKLKLVVETKYNIERKLVQGENEKEGAIGEKLSIDDDHENDFVNLVYVDERKRWKMKRTESLPDLSLDEEKSNEIYEGLE
ncbi:uncharacterized protein [Eurosta solidaginis]|uniref:uncharacterized protein n=1 Tax=Eurosta solidaginis TaxID=178769 RepID=UPI00353139EC